MSKLRNRTLALGKVALNGRGKRNAAELEIKLADKDGNLVLSICGSIWNEHRTDCDVCGQCIGTITGFFPRDAEMQELKAIWERWHLNDMRPGCEHQRKMGWDNIPIDPSKPTNTYGKHFPGQKHSTWNMLTWITREEHPDGLLSFPCPECGYKYGSQWLYEPIPAEVIDRLAAIADILEARYSKPAVAA